MSTASVTNGLMRQPPRRAARRQGQFGHFYGVDPSEEWYTPRVVLEALGLEFALDPCRPVEGPIPWIPARHSYSKADDGLLKPWRGLVWMNPPYGAATPCWMEKLAAHGAGVALVYARTDTYWFHDAARAARAVCFIKGRVRFVDRLERELASGRPGSGSVLFGFGDIAAGAVRRCGLGWVP